MAVSSELERLRGRVGRTLSPLRPAGLVDFDGQRIDCLSEGILVEPGTWVRCIDVKPGKVLVRPIDEPDLAKLENVDFT
jgi:membrane-bound serine protease (ClpP class)